MFEKFTDHVSVMRIAAAGNTQKLKKLIEAGCNLNRRIGPADPWMTPLDAAVASGHLECVEMLVAGECPCYWFSICEAIVRDSTEVLDIFAKDDIRFYQNFVQTVPAADSIPTIPS
jgi:hypothetical protein